MYFPNFINIGIEELLVVAFVISMFGIIYYYIKNSTVIIKYNLQSYTQSNAEPVSVIICARNEDDNLTEFLPKILMQNYLTFEVIVVNDCSTDNTENVIDEFAKIFPNLKKVNIKEDDYYKHGKKFAIMVGIKGAKYDTLVFTDADCFPASEDWLTQMASGFTTDKEIVLGYGAYNKEPTFLNKLIRFDTLIIASNYISAAIKGEAYMGVGRNLAYKKELFYKQKGFSKHYHINSGDDDLFINQASTTQNTNVVLSDLATTYSIPEQSFSAWKRQKQRHLTTAPHYTLASKLNMMFGYFIQYAFWILFFSTLFFKATCLIGIGIFLVKTVAQLFIYKKVTKQFKETDLWPLVFFYELLLLCIYPLFYISKLFYKSNKWKS